MLNINIKRDQKQVQQLNYKAFTEAVSAPHAQVRLMVTLNHRQKNINIKS